MTKEGDQGCSLSELLYHYRETKYKSGKIPQGYWRRPHELWRRLTHEEQVQYISSLPNSLVALFLHMMLGEPEQSLQPQNRFTFPVFETVFHHKLQVLAEPNEDFLPRWIGVVNCFNRYEDGTTSEALEMIKNSLYPDSHDRIAFRNHLRLLRDMSNSQP